MAIPAAPLGFADGSPCEELGDQLHAAQVCMHDGDARVNSQNLTICGMHVGYYPPELQTILDTQIGEPLALERGWSADGFESLFDGAAAFELDACSKVRVNEPQSEETIRTEFAFQFAFQFDPGRPVHVRLVAARGYHYIHTEGEGFDGDVGSNWPCIPVFEPSLTALPGCELLTEAEDGSGCIHVDHLNWRLGERVELCPGLWSEEHIDYLGPTGWIWSRLHRCEQELNRQVEVEIPIGSEMKISADVCLSRASPTTVSIDSFDLGSLVPEQAHFRYRFSRGVPFLEGRVRDGEVVVPSLAELQRRVPWSGAESM